MEDVKNRATDVALLLQIKIVQVTMDQSVHQMAKKWGFQKP